MASTGEMHRDCLKISCLWERLDHCTKASRIKFLMYDSRDLYTFIARQEVYVDLFLRCMEKCLAYTDCWGYCKRASVHQIFLTRISSILTLTNEIIPKTLDVRRSTPRVIMTGEETSIRVSSSHVSKSGALKIE